MAKFVSIHVNFVMMIFHDKIANRRPVKRSNTMPTGEAAKNILFQQYKRQQQQDRELLKELWRKRHSHRTAELETVSLTSSGLSRARSDLNLSGHSSDSNWFLVIPSQRIKPRICDEVPDEFRRAGIGLCFEGERRMKKGITKTLSTTSLRNTLFILISHQFLRYQIYFITSLF